MNEVPPKVEETCSLCRNVLDETGWCWTCAFKRQRFMAMNVTVLLMVAGFTACVIPAGAGPDQGNWANWAFGIGTVLFLGGPVVWYLILNRFYKEHPKRK